MNKIERLAEMASRQADPRPLDAAGIMARIRGLEIEEAGEVLPMTFLTGGAAAAAAAAVFVSVLAVSAWRDIAEPLVSIDALVNVMDLIS